MPRLGARGRVLGRGIAALALLASLAAGLLVFADRLAGVLTPAAVQATKAGIAASAALLLLADALLRRRGRDALWRGPRDGLLVALALASVLAWWNFMQFHHPRYVHLSDTYHYFIGAKYFPELGYTRLYACTAVADAEAGPRTKVGRRSLRNLETNRLEPARSVLADPAACKRHFSAERWRAFAYDIAWFRSRVPFEQWHAMQADHGYNAPPSWTLLWSGLANRAPAGDARILFLTALDVPLLAAMWAGVAWAFGWRALCVALVFWGTNLFSDFGWVGGSFARQSWLAAAVGGLCCLRRDKPFLAGALLALSTLLRVFPGAILVGVGIRAAWETARTRRLAPEHGRLLAGGLAAVVVLAALSSASGLGLEAWRGFVDNSRVHLSTPLSNHLGLSTWLSYDADHVERKLTTSRRNLEHFEPWKRARRERLAERAPFYWAGVAAFGVLLALAVRRQPDWIAALLGIGLVPVAFQLTSYYLAILLGYALLAPRWRDVGAALCAVSALGWVAAATWQWWDEVFTWCSALVVLFVLYATARVWRGGAPDPTPVEAPQSELPGSFTRASTGR